MSTTEALAVLPTPAEVASLATSATAETLEAFLSAIPTAQVPTYLVRIDDAKALLNVMQKALESRMVLDGQTGADFEVDGQPYGFFGAQQKGWEDVPGLVRGLLHLGFAMPSIADAVSELRVTDLRAAAEFIKDEDKRKEVLALIEEHRKPKGARGAPHMQLKR